MLGIASNDLNPNTLTRNPDQFLFFIAYAAISLKHTITKSLILYSSIVFMYHCQSFSSKVQGYQIPTRTVSLNTYSDQKSRNLQQTTVITIHRIILDTTTFI